MSDDAAAAAADDDDDATWEAASDYWGNLSPMELVEDHWRGCDW